MTVLQCFWFSAWPSVTLRLTLVLSLILLNLGNYLCLMEWKQKAGMFFHWHIPQNNIVFSTLHAFLFHIIAFLILIRDFSDCFQVFALLTLYFNNTLYFRSAATQRTIIWAWCLHLDNLFLFTMKTQAGQCYFHLFFFLLCCFYKPSTGDHLSCFLLLFSCRHCLQLYQWVPLQQMELSQVHNELFDLLLRSKRCMHMQSKKIAAIVSEIIQRLNLAMISTAYKIFFKLYRCVRAS